MIFRESMFKTEFMTATKFVITKTFDNNKTWDNNKISDHNWISHYNWTFDRSFTYSATVFRLQLNFRSRLNKVFFDLNICRLWYDNVKFNAGEFGFRDIGGGRRTDLKFSAGSWFFHEWSVSSESCAELNFHMLRNPRHPTDFTPSFPLKGLLLTFLFCLCRITAPFPGPEILSLG